jgi:hypothetical protein
MIVKGHNLSLYNFQNENEVQRIWDNFSSCILLTHYNTTTNEVPPLFFDIKKVLNDTTNNYYK